MDFAEPIKGWCDFIVEGTFGKRVEVSKTTTEWCITQLNKKFTTFGLPHVLGSDSGTQFTSKLFEDYRKKYEIVYKQSSLFALNQAERAS